MKCKMIYEKEIINYVCVHSDRIAYHSLFDEQEKNLLVDLIKKVFNRNFANEKSVRLDGIDYNSNMKISISLLEFYDFLVTNFAVLNMDKLLNNANLVERALLLRLKDAIDNAAIKEFDDICKHQFLSNIIAVSCLVKDKKGRVLLTRRNNNVGIANGFLSVSVTGSVDFFDFQSEDPFLACCEREIEEELGLSLGADSDIKLKKIVCGEKKLQPIALIDVIVDDIQLVVESLKKCQGFCEENSQYYICEFKEIKTMLESGQYNVTEAGLAHLESVI